MATKLTTNTFLTTYRDDYKDSDNYHRVLFNSGKALQARELTQMQTIIQEEISRMGSNLYREGSPIVAGGITLNNRMEYIKLNTSANPLPANPQELVGREFTVESPNPAVKFVVVEVVPATLTDPATLYVRYTDTSASVTTGAAPVRIPNSATFVTAGYGALKASTIDATGRGTKISVGSGEYYTQGHFVFAKEQSIFVSKYTSNPSGDVGFQIVEQVITAEDDVALYDNQGDNPNRSAPGADRYRIKLTLIMRDDLPIGENFVYIAKINEGEIVDEASGADAYNRINDVLALRTKEESGNYVIKPFIAKFNELSDTSLELDVSSGIAYVDGYRLEIPTSKIEVPKAQSTITLAGENIVASYGNYILINPADCSNLPVVSTMPQFNIRSAIDYGGSTIGTARIRALQEDGANINCYLFDIQMQTGQSFKDARSLGTNNSNYVNVVLDGGQAKLRNAANNSLLFPLPNQRPSSSGVTVTSITQQYYNSTASNSSGQIPNVAAPSGFTWTDAFDWIVCEENGPVRSSAVVTLNSAGTSYTITGLASSTTYQIFGYRAKSNPQKRQKYLQQNQTLTVAWPGDAITDNDGNRYIDLGRSDILKVRSIQETNANGSDLSFNFIVDNGQRDNFYANGRLVEKGGVSIPNGFIYIVFDYFTHASSGDFFSVNSYDGVIDYDNIQDYTKDNGEVINLRDVIDLRPVQSVNGDYSGVGAVIHQLPQNTDTMTAEVQYYLPRRDRLIATVQNSRDGRFGLGELKIVQGVPAVNPQLPDIPSGSIPLYDIDLNAYTLNDSDMTTLYHVNKRYTMKDISMMEERLDDLTELTTLSLLELNAANINVFDSNGLSRTKAGFLADNFSSYSFSDIFGLEYKAAVDPAENTLTCQQQANSVRLYFDENGGSTNVVRKGDLMLLDYDSASFLSQNLATETENVNPFAVVTQVGQIEMSPQADNWVETRFAPNVIVDGGERINNIAGTVAVNNINTWRNSWFGRPVNGNRVQVVTGSRVIRDLIGQRIVDVSIIPFMRSIKVSFKASGLKPNSRFWPFFNGVAVDQWVRSESSFIRYSSNTADPGNTYTNLTGHPSGSTSLVTNSNGELTGSFVIPSTASLKFRVGTQVFKLLDISVNDENLCTSLGKTTFVSRGTVETVERTIRQTQEIDVRWFQNRDPLAQSFRVDQFENRSGIFIHKVRLFFATKDSGNLPVEVQIRRMEAGVPTSVPINGASKYLNPSEVNVPSNLNNLTDIRNTPTDFIFDEPVYLAPGQDYAIVILSDSIEYTVHVAKIYDFLIGSTEARVSRQPTLGSLFLSQNSRTWTPDQTRDMMFEIYRCDFETSGVGYLNNAPVARHLLEPNSLLTSAGDSDVRVFNTNHGFIKNDLVYISGLDSASTYAGISGSDINGVRTINYVDHTGFRFKANTAASDTLRIGGNTVVSDKNIMVNSYIPSVATLVPEGTTLAPRVKLLSGESFANGTVGRNTDNSGAYSKDVTYTDITFNEVNTTETPKLIASSRNEFAKSVAGQASVSMQLDFATLDTKVTPIIDLQRANITAFENIIDKQSNTSNDGFNIPMTYVAETDPNAGSASAKHVTSQVTLINSAVGLKILIAANRPSASEILAYFKSGTSDELLETKPWVQLNPEFAVPADDDGVTFREYEFLAGGIGGDLDPFTKFQIKLVFNSTNSSKVPVVRDLRAIALG